MSDEFDDYIEQRFGSSALARLEHINRGGSNNAKGVRFEDNYAVYQICKLHYDGKADGASISSQEKAFVDDLCVRLADQTKYNYQAKNSDGAAASWTDEITDRFKKQREIDLGFYRAPDSVQVLVVSCPEKKAANDHKIPDEMSSYAFCEHFPPGAKAYEIVRSSPQLREIFGSICANDALSTLDQAVQLLRGQWVDVADGDQASVTELVDRARALSKPDIFYVAQPPSVPEWLHDLLAPFLEVDIRVESSDFIVRVGGLSARLPGDREEEMRELVPATLVEDKQVLVELLVKLSALRFQ